MSLILDGFVCITLQFYIINFIPACLLKYSYRVIARIVMQERGENIFGRANE